MFLSALFASAAFLTAVNAHGKVQQVTANGKTYTAPLIGAGGDPQFFYIPADNSPIKDPNSAQTLCGNVATKPTSSLSVAPGTTLDVRWSSGYSNELTNWPHNTGPIFWYMAKCSNDCSGSTKWFKLQQDGFQAPGVWKQADLFNGKTISFSIPSDLAPGEYTIRNEIINLASTAEMFPGCVNVQVTGSGSKVLSGVSTTFPGAYSLSDAGLSVAGAPVYSITSNAGYTFPGPPVVALGNAGSGDDSGSGGSSPTTTAGSSTTFVPVGNAGGNPDDTETVTTSSTTTSADGGASTPSSTPGDGNSTGGGDTGSTPPPTTSGEGISGCAAAWTSCNANYKGTADDQANYKCQTDYVNCVQSAMANTTVRRMHRRHRALFGTSSH